MSRRAMFVLWPLFLGMAVFFVVLVPDVGVALVVLLFIILPLIVWPFMKETA